MKLEQWQARITEVTPNLWVGEVAVRSYHYLRPLDIDTVVSCMTVDQHRMYDKSHPVIQGIPRHPKFNFGDNDPLTVEQIDEMLAAFGNRTLLHCVSGSNRSQAIALCRLMSTGWSVVRAFHTFNKTRSKSVAYTYHAPAKLSDTMANNVQRWALAKGIGV